MYHDEGRQLHYGARIDGMVDMALPTLVATRLGQLKLICRWSRAQMSRVAPPDPPLGTLGRSQSSVTISSVPPTHRYVEPWHTSDRPYVEDPAFNTTPSLPEVAPEIYIEPVTPRSAVNGSSGPAADESLQGPGRGSSGAAEIA